MMTANILAGKKELPGRDQDASRNGKSCQRALVATRSNAGRNQRVSCTKTSLVPRSTLLSSNSIMIIGVQHDRKMSSSKKRHRAGTAETQASENEAIAQEWITQTIAKTTDVASRLPAVVALAAYRSAVREDHRISELKFGELLVKLLGPPANCRISLQDLQERLPFLHRPDVTGFRLTTYGAATIVNPAQPLTTLRPAAYATECCWDAAAAATLVQDALRRTIARTIDS
jgi:hypothetical protein